MAAREWPRFSVQADKDALSRLVEEERIADLVNGLQEEHIAYLSNDELTGLKNRGSFDASLEQMLKLAHRGMKVAVISFDVDHFKKVNDTLGHTAGDEVLRKIGALVKSSIREVDAAGRVGGEEFMVVLAEADESIAAKKAEQLRTKIGELVFEGYPDLKVTASFGVIALNGSQNSEEVRKVVDEQLYKAKHGGRNRIEVKGMHNIT